MKTYFIQDNPKFYRRRWGTSYYALTEYGGHFTDDYTLHQAIFMAHDLLACHYLCIVHCPEVKPAPVLDDDALKKILDKYFPNLPIIGAMDIDVDIKNGVWVRKGDLPPATHQHIRIKQYRKAFALTYKDIILDKIKYP